MRVKPRSLHERAVDRLLRRTLTDTEWVIGANTSLQSVLDKDRSLTPAEFSLYTRGHLDFVVSRADDDEPEFAIEFDGFAHQDPRQVERDIIKNRLCAEAGLPLLRIGHDELRTRERITVLEWLVERFIAWEMDAANAADELTSGLEVSGRLNLAEALRADADELVNLVAATFSDENPFPGNLEVAQRLSQSFGIALSVRIDDQPQQGSRFTLDVKWPGRHAFADLAASSYATCEREAFVRASNGEVVFTTAGRARVAAANRIGSGPSDFAECDLPWLQPDWLAMDLALYDVLVKTEAWAATSEALSPKRA